jgi:hypothetical protein
LRPLRPHKCGGVFSLCLWAGIDVTRLILACAAPETWLGTSNSA